jgi:hypothetical protein
MTDYLPEAVLAGLAEARKRDQRRRSRLCVHAGEAVYPILRFWETGFSLDAETVLSLRGRVDIYDGPKHLYNSLIVATDIEAGELICTMKRSTLTQDRPPLDYERDDDMPAGYLPKA